MTKLLLDEAPLMVIPSLAVSIGLNESIVLQQLHYLTVGKFGKIIEGRRFIYNTLEKWRDTYFPFWTVKTIQRTFKALEDAGYVIGLQEKSYYRQKLYAINYERLDAIRTNCPHPSGQIVHMEEDKLSTSIQREDYTKTTADANAPASAATIGVASISVMATNVANSASLESESESKVTVARLDVGENIFNLATKAKTAATVIRKWKLPAHLEDLCITFAEVFGIEADGPNKTLSNTKQTKGKWLRGATELAELNPTHAELIKARDIARANRYPIAHPGAAVNTITNLRQSARQTKPPVLTHPQPVTFREVTSHDDE